MSLSSSGKAERFRALRLARVAYASDMAEDAVQDAYLAALELGAADLHGCATSRAFNAARDLRRAEKGRRRREEAWAREAKVRRGFAAMPEQRLREISAAGRDGRARKTELRAAEVRRLAALLDWRTFKELNALLRRAGLPVDPRVMRGYLAEYTCTKGSVKGFNHNRAAREERQAAVRSLAAALSWSTIADLRRQLSERGVTLDKKTVARYVSYPV